MFVDHSQFDDFLRQGDVVKNVHILGAVNLNAIQYLGTPDALGEANYQSWQVPSQPNFMDAVVLSHDCEISLENRVKLTSIILAPIRDIHTATAPEKIQELIDSNLIEQSNPYATYLKYFYLEANPELHFESGGVIDFSKCFSVRKQSYNNLLEKKIAQLNDETRKGMSLKLSLYFHRLQQPA